MKKRVVLLVALCIWKVVAAQTPYGEMPERFRPAALPCERLSRKQIMKLIRILRRHGGNPAFPGLQTVSYNGKIICLKIRAEARDIWRHRNYV